MGEGGADRPALRTGSHQGLRGEGSSRGGEALAWRRGRITAGVGQSVPVQGSAGAKAHREGRRHGEKWEGSRWKTAGSSAEKFGTR